MNRMIRALCQAQTRRLLALLVVLSAVLSSLADPPVAQEVQGTTVTINEIVPNQVISGRVNGLTDPSRYQVVVYVKTDKWYIHPYERGGIGLSFASINADGSWQIRTVKREFLADWVAALVVRRDTKVPPSTGDISEIPAIATYREAGEGRL